MTSGRPLSRSTGSIPQPSGVRGGRLTSCSRALVLVLVIVLTGCRAQDSGVAASSRAVGPAPAPGPMIPAERLRQMGVIARGRELSGGEVEGWTRAFASGQRSVDDFIAALTSEPYLMDHLAAEAMLGDTLTKP